VFLLEEAPKSPTEHYVIHRLTDCRASTGAAPVFSMGERRMRLTESHCPLQDHRSTAGRVC